MTMVHVAACEAIEGCSYRDHFTRVDTHRIFPAQFVRIERPMPLKADGCRRCSRFWMEAVQKREQRRHPSAFKGMGRSMRTNWAGKIRCVSTLVKWSR